MRIGSPVSIQRPAYYAGLFAVRGRAGRETPRAPRRIAPTLPPQRCGDAAALTLFAVQAMAEPRPLDAAAAHAAYARAQRDDEAILVRLAV